jgi:hypothetical protein
MRFMILIKATKEIEAVERKQTCDDKRQIKDYGGIYALC